MSRLVAVSNRLPILPSSGDRPTLPAGGLVSCLFSALQLNRGGGLWVGWDPEASPSEDVSRARVRTVDFLGIGLEPELVAGYYRGFCNQTLWPVLHGFPTRATFSADQFADYRSAQCRFARELLAELRDDDRVWIHDYHLFLLPELLRQAGFGGRIGFFLHTPFPSADAWAVIPAAACLLSALDQADLIGLQTARDRDNLQVARRRLKRAGLGQGTKRHSAVVVVPAGIEASDFEPDAAAARRPKSASRLATWVSGRRVLLGVDRLDYSKGLVERIRAYRTFLEQYPTWRRRVCLVQIAAPSRGGLGWYRRERREIERQVGRINGDLGDVDWTPIRYLHRSLTHSELARFYRGADVGLVTPLRDGMNLVAKEFVAAQRRSDPGVLVLSEFAGAATAMRDALLVNPYFFEQTAHTIHMALEMPLAERRIRHARLLRVVRRDSSLRWAERFLDRLGRSGTTGSER